jgi:hypothetical protein
MASLTKTNTFVASTPAVASEVNTNFDEIVTFCNDEAFHADGAKTMSGNLDMGTSYKIINLAAPTAGTDAVNKTYADAGYRPSGTDVAVADGGTGASTAAAARTNLGLVIGTDVQAQDAALDDFAGLTQAADKLPYFDSASTMATTDLTAAGRALLDDASASAQRTTLGLGALATLATVDTAQIDADAVTLTEIEDTAWQTPTFSGTWANHSAARRDLRCRKLLDSIVFVEGVIKNDSSITIPSDAFTLPDGYRPADDISVPIATGDPVLTTANPRLFVQTTGVCRVFGLTTPQAVAEVSFSFCFSTDT